MSRFVSKTLRKLPSATREVAPAQQRDRLGAGPVGQPGYRGWPSLRVRRTPPYG